MWIPHESGKSYLCIYLVSYCVWDAVVRWFGIMSSYASVIQFGPEALSIKIAVYSRVTPTSLLSSSVNQTIKAVKHSFPPSHQISLSIDIDTIVWRPSSRQLITTNQGSSQINNNDRNKDTINVKLPSTKRLRSWPLGSQVDHSYSGTCTLSPPWYLLLSCMAWLTSLANSTQQQAEASSPDSRTQRAITSTAAGPSVPMTNQQVFSDGCTTGELPSRTFIYGLMLTEW